MGTGGSSHSTAANELQWLEGQALKRLRKATPRLTQRKVADRLGCKPEQVSQWETGKVRPQPETVLRLLGILGSSLADYANALAEAAWAGKPARERPPERRPRPGAHASADPAEDDLPPAAEIHEPLLAGLRAGVPGHHGDDRVEIEIQIRDLSLRIPIDRASIGLGGSRRRRHGDV